MGGCLAVMLGHSSGSASAGKLAPGAQPPGLGCPAWSHCNLDEFLVVSMRSWYSLRVGDVRIAKLLTPRLMPRRWSSESVRSKFSPEPMAVQWASRPCLPWTRGQRMCMGPGPGGILSPAHQMTRRPCTPSHHPYHALFDFAATNSPRLFDSPSSTNATESCACARC